VVGLLVAAGGDLDLADGSGRTPLMVNISYRMDAAARMSAAWLLLAAGTRAGGDVWTDTAWYPRADKAALLAEAAWARRGHLVRLRRRVNPNSQQAAADEAKAALLTAVPAGDAAAAAGVVGASGGGAAASSWALDEAAAGCRSHAQVP
jgi:hypothetical protein